MITAMITIMIATKMITTITILEAAALSMPLLEVLLML
jgi:hypothetical protein